VHIEPVLKVNTAPPISALHQAIRTESMNFHYSTTEQRSHTYALHCHNFYEIFYFVAGNVSYLVEGKSYEPQPGSILLISPHVFHGVRIDSDRPYVRYALHFEARMIEPDNRERLLTPFHAANGPSGIYYPQAADLGMHDYFRQLMACRSMTDDMREMSLRIRLEGLLTQLLVLSQSAAGHPLAKPPGTSVALMIEYLNEHIAEPFALDDIAAKFYLSKHHLNKVFRKATGTTVGNYVIHKRVSMAQQWMMQGQTAGVAAASAGFRDYSAFYRAYRNIFGHAPSDDLAYFANAARKTAPHSR